MNYTPNVTDLTKHSVSDNIVFKKIFYLKITVSTVINAADIKYPRSIDQYFIIGRCANVYCTTKYNVYKCASCEMKIPFSATYSNTILVNQVLDLYHNPRS